MSTSATASHSSSVRGGSASMATDRAARVTVGEQAADGGAVHRAPVENRRSMLAVVTKTLRPMRTDSTLPSAIQRRTVRSGDTP